MPVSIRGNKQLQQKFTRLDDALPKLARRSVNRTLRSARTYAVKKIGESINLKASQIKHDFRESKANYRTLEATLRNLTEAVPLMRYKGTRELANGRGVSVKVSKNAARTRLKHAFILTPKQGGAVVALRQIRGGKRVGRTPLEFPYGPSPSQYWRQWGARETRAEAKKNLERFLAHEIQHEADKFR